jgi:hypothetical protein
MSMQCVMFNDDLDIPEVYRDLDFFLRNYEHVLASKDAEHDM